MTISQKFLPKANKRRVITNAILIAPIFALLSACGGGDVPYGDSLDAQAAEMTAVRPENYQVESVAAPNSDTTPPVMSDTAATAADGTPMANTVAEATPPANPAPAAANPGATPADAANAATPPADAANQAAAANGGAPAAAPVDAANLTPGAAATASSADAANPALPDGTSTAQLTLAANGQLKMPVPTSAGSAQGMPAGRP